jgi:hypothetical protein
MCPGRIGEAAPNGQFVVETEEIGKVAETGMDRAWRLARIELVDRHRAAIGHFERGETAQ